MNTRIMVNLDPTERKALAKLAEHEMRPIREQIRFLLRMELRQRGYLPSVGNKPMKDKATSKEDNAKSR